MITDRIMLGRIAILWCVGVVAVAVEAVKQGVASRTAMSGDVFRPLRPARSLARPNNAPPRTRSD
jgi:hypothetical protein